MSASIPWSAIYTNFFSTKNSDSKKKKKIMKYDNNWYECLRIEWNLFNDDHAYADVTKNLRYFIQIPTSTKDLLIVSWDYYYFRCPTFIWIHFNEWFLYEFWRFIYILIWKYQKWLIISTFSVNFLGIILGMFGASDSIIQPSYFHYLYYFPKNELWKPVKYGHQVTI